VKLISPFVGRILDWYKKNSPTDDFSDSDPGVNSVKAIYRCYKNLGYKTEIMGASFRSIAEIMALAGCDLLTISPKFLEEMESLTTSISRQIENYGGLLPIISSPSSEKEFRFLLNENQMATEKLSEGIRLFVKDTISLERMLLSVTI
jgi:transaldolase